MEEAHRLGDIDRQLALESKVYADNRAILEDALAEVFRDPADTIDSLLSWSDEFGRDHALELFSEEIHKSPDALEISPARWSDVLSSVNGQIQRVLDSQERLDELTSQKDQAMPSKDGRLVNIQGEGFQIDGPSMQLRSVEGRGSVNIEPEQALTLTEQMAHDLNVSKAGPSPEDQNRGRSR